jgi:ParB family chromosome partitioning protein
VENIHRKTLGPIEEADAFKTYIPDFGCGGASDLATKIGKSKSYITKRIKLLNLPSDVLHSVITHKIAVSIAEELFQVKDQNKQSLLANLISNRRLSMRMTRKFIKEQDERDITFQSSYKNEYIHHVRLVERSFDKSIAAIIIAMNSLGEVINRIEHDWIVHEVLMQHKNMLHTQIEYLLQIYYTNYHMICFPSSSRTVSLSQSKIYHNQEYDLDICILVSKKVTTAH